MATKKPHSIEFRIQHIETLQYAILVENLDEQKLAYAISFSYGLDTSTKIIRTMFKFELLQNKELALILEIGVDCAIEPKCFDKNIQKENGYLIPSDFAIHMAMIAVGTARGVLHEKTKDSSLNKFPIPTINVSNAIQSDILFEEQVA